MRDAGKLRVRRNVLVVRLIGEKCMREKYERRQKAEDLHLLANYSMKLRTKIPLTLVILLLTRSLCLLETHTIRSMRGRRRFA